MVSGLVERNGNPIRFVTFLKTSQPLMLMIVAIAHGYLWVRHFL